MNTCHVIVSARINNPDKVDAYRKVAGPLMKKHDAIMPPTSYKITRVLAGKAQPTQMLKISFPSLEKAIAAFEDPEYIAVIAERDEGFGDLSIVLVE